MHGLYKIVISLYFGNIHEIISCVFRDLQGPSWYKFKSGGIVSGIQLYMWRAVQSFQHFSLLFNVVVTPY